MSSPLGRILITSLRLLGDVLSGLDITNLDILFLRRSMFLINVDVSRGYLQRVHQKRPCPIQFLFRTRMLLKDPCLRARA